MKIVYCLNSISQVGGVEMVTITKANALADVEGNEVYLIVTDNNRDTDIACLSPKVKLIDLEVNYFQIGCKSKWVFLLELWNRHRLYKKRIKKALYDIMPDILVSVGGTEKYLLPSVGGGDWKLVREMHTVKDWRYKLASSRWQKIVAHMGTFYECYYNVKQYDAIVLLTNEDKNINWRNYKNVLAIPNPLTFIVNKTSQLTCKRIISVGRLVAEKNYYSLIRAYKKVVEKHPDWILDIYGNGGEMAGLQALINTLDLDKNVFLKGYTLQVQEKMIEASCFVLSSKFEGFCLALTEAMQCGLPVISYDCPYGPRDIITDGKDGFLVPLNDEEALAEKICFLIEHPDIMVEMGKAALMKAEKYNIDNIIPMWMDLFNRLLEQR